MNKIIIKRLFDLCLSAVLIVVLCPLIVLSAVIARFDTKLSGIYKQTRIGEKGVPFTIYKIRTMRDSSSSSTITVANDVRITRIGAFMRKYKIDEFPQLVNILEGKMSFVGPRPDVPGYADKLEGKYRKILEFKPGLTGPAQLNFHNEEELLVNQSNPIEYNQNIIWPTKVEINFDYVSNWSFRRDIVYLIKTIFR